MSLLPIEENLDVIHTRQYETRVYQLSDDKLLVRGAVSDRKPPGLYVSRDPEPLEVHQMQLELRVSLPDLTIENAQVVFETHPHLQCPLIARDYERLVGISIARGFNRKIRELFGGERGCTHTNALLQAMAPAVIQATWSVSIRKSREAGQGLGLRNAPDREKRMAANVNTCHIWAEDGDHVAAIRRGDLSNAPLLPVRDRLAKLGRGNEEWE